MDNRYIVLDLYNQTTHGPMSLFRAEDKRNELQKDRPNAIFSILLAGNLDPESRRKKRNLPIISLSEDYNKIWQTEYEEG